jgi:hypothetical protein
MQIVNIKYFLNIVYLLKQDTIITENLGHPAFNSHVYYSCHKVASVRFIIINISLK